jgi:hypothetical protein
MKLGSRPIIRKSLIRNNRAVINRQCASAMGLLPMSADRPPAVAYKGAI